MLMVKTQVKPSPIAGLGLFADEDIPKGTVTWRFMSGYDQVFGEAAIEALPEAAQSALRDHTYLDAVTGLYVLCADNARFMNHADDPNTEGVHGPGEIEGYDVALRDIRKGEELTCDYRIFDANVGEKLGGR